MVGVPGRGVIDTGVVFFGIDEACELAIAKWGHLARCWADFRGPVPGKRCQLGTGGAGMSHVALGTGDTWLEAE